jgi:hypothetical protein
MDDMRVFEVPTRRPERTDEGVWAVPLWVTEGGRTHVADVTVLVGPYATADTIAATVLDILASPAALEVITRQATGAPDQPVTAWLEHRPPGNNGAGGG